MNKRKMPCLILSVWLSFALVFQILGVCIPAHADLNIPDWAFAYDIFETSYEERLEEIRARDGVLAQIINDPDIPLEEKRSALVSNALVTFDYKFAIENFQRWEIDDFTNVPDTVTYEMSGGTGFYRLTSDGDIFPVVVTNMLTQGVTSNFIDAPDFTFHLSAPSNYYTEVKQLTDLSDRSRWSLMSYYTSGNASARQILGTGIGYETFEMPAYVNYSTIYFGLYNNTIPVLSGVQLGYNASSSSPTMIGGMGSSVTLPVATVDSKTPWDYYNNTLMPYILDNYSSDYYNIRDLLPFPYGYTPVIPEPTEPLTAPNGGLTINNNWNIGINIIYPTDSSGQPVTDESGETVTETEYVTETYPPDGEYNFQIPTLERLRVYDATLPEINLTAFTDGFNFIWIATENIFTRSGFMPVVLACLGLAVVCYIIWKVGG